MIRRFVLPALLAAVLIGALGTGYAYYAGPQGQTGPFSLTDHDREDDHDDDDRFFGEHEDDD